MIVSYNATCSLLYSNLKNDLPYHNAGVVAVNSEIVRLAPDQGYQMVYFQTKNPILSKFWRALEWKILVYYLAIWNMYFTSIWYILWPFDNIVVIRYKFHIFFTALVHCVKKIWQPCSRCPLRGSDLVPRKGPKYRVAISERGAQLCNSKQRRIYKKEAALGYLRRLPNRRPPKMSAINSKLDKTARHVTYFAGSEIVDRKNVNSQFKAKATLFSRLSNRRPKKCQHSIQSKGTYVGTTAM
jgi:hypothetical protein